MTDQEKQLQLSFDDDGVKDEKLNNVSVSESEAVSADAQTADDSPILEKSGAVLFEDDDKSVIIKPKRTRKKPTTKTASKEEFEIPSEVVNEDSEQYREINNDLYNLYIGSYVSPEKYTNDYTKPDEDEDLYTPNTAYVDELPPEQIMLADETEELEEKEEEEPALPPYSPEKPRKIDGKFDFIELFIFTLLAVMIVTSFFFRHSIVEGGSMENTLIDGEHLIISNVFYTPKPGDIIVCEDYGTGLKKPIVKRVIAVAGDTISIKANGNVYVNGVLVNEDYVFVDNDRYVYEPMTTIVPEGEIFVMGDHRNASTDSRDFGTVDTDSILGRVLLRFYPFDKFGKVE